MVEWCPKCNAMLTPGLEVCPKCGKQLGNGGDQEVTAHEIFSYSLVFLAIALVPILVVLAIGIICVLALR